MSNLQHPTQLTKAFRKTPPLSGQCAKHNGFQVHLPVLEMLSEHDLIELSGDFIMLHFRVLCVHRDGHLLQCCQNRGKRNPSDQFPSLRHALQHLSLTKTSIPCKASSRPPKTANKQREPQTDNKRARGPGGSCTGCSQTLGKEHQLLELLLSGGLNELLKPRRQQLPRSQAHQPVRQHIHVQSSQPHSSCILAGRAHH